MISARIRWHGILPFAPVALLAVFGWRQRWIGDDGFINVRVAANLLAGDGFTYNVGERVEAVTSPLWVFCMTLLGSVGLPLDRGAVYLGWLLTLIGMVAGISGSRALLHSAAPDRVGLELPAGALTYAAIPAAWDYATSGLENGLSIAWLGIAFRLLASAVLLPDLKWPLTAAAWLGLAPLVRPELALYAGVLFPFLTAIALPREAVLSVRARRAALLVALAGVSGAAYQVFRMGYFASMVPNTALAKEAFLANWTQGFHYLQNTLSAYRLTWPLAACLALSVLTIRRLYRSGLSGPAVLLCLLLVGGTLHIVYVVRVGGDFMHARMLLPGIFAFLLPAAVVAPSGLSDRLSVSLLAANAAWAVLCIAMWRVSPKNDHGIGDERGWHARHARVSNPTTIDDYRRFPFYVDAARVRSRIEKWCPSGAYEAHESAQGRCKRVVVPMPKDKTLKRARSKTLVVDPESVGSNARAVVSRRPLGIVGVVLGPTVHVADYYGLADPIGARLEPRERRKRPGHEKNLTSVWLAARFATDWAALGPSVVDAKNALHCGALAELLDAVRRPLDLQRFFRNLSIAYHYRDLRVPRDPSSAKKRFCPE